MNEGLQNVYCHTRLRRSRVLATFDIPRLQGTSLNHIGLALSDKPSQYILVPSLLLSDRLRKVD